MHSSITFEALLQYRGQIEEKEKWTKVTQTFYQQSEIPMNSTCFFFFFQVTLNNVEVCSENIMTLKKTLEVCCTLFTVFFFHYQTCNILPCGVK